MRRSHNIQRENMEKEEGKTGEIEIELTLGLSMNGKFGVDPIRSNKLKRSCSTISNSQETTRSELTSPGTPSCWAMGEVLPRTCSLPNRKKMKELHCPPLPNRNTAVTAVKVNYQDEDEDENDCPRMVSQRSTGSSGLSELEIQATPSPLHGMNRTAEAKSPQSVQSFSEQKEHKVKPARSISAPYGIVQNARADMPCVSAEGEGPNGKRVDGFLYRYKKGDEVRIVCVCHGNFLTPAEFVEHAGGGAVEHPLRHIIVNPSPSL